VCDGCGLNTRTEPDFVVTRINLVEGARKTDVLEFCSQDCLYDWSKQGRTPDGCAIDHPHCPLSEESHP
jgi:hypothetical protein